MYWNIENKEGHTILRPAPDVDFSSIILGMAIRPDPKTGALCYAMCARRRGGGKLWQMDYDDEAVCDAEIDNMRGCIDASNAHPELADISRHFNTMARRLTQFNEETGAVVADVDLTAEPAVPVTKCAHPDTDFTAISIRDHVLRSAQGWTS